MVQIVFTISIVTLIFSCTDSKQYPGARMIWSRHENGKEKIAYQYMKDTADLGDDYYYQEYYENGNLKLEGLENRQIRKGEWKNNYENGYIKASMYFVDDTLDGPIVLFDEDGDTIAKGMAKKGVLDKNHKEIVRFINHDFNPSTQRAVWFDSLKSALDTLQSNFKNNSN